MSYVGEPRAHKDIETCTQAAKHHARIEKRSERERERERDRETRDKERGESERMRQRQSDRLTCLACPFCAVGWCSTRGPSQGLETPYHDQLKQQDTPCLNTHGSRNMALQ